jgi:hypothetical protein
MATLSGLPPALSSRVLSLSLSSNAGSSASLTSKDSKAIITNIQTLVKQAQELTSGNKENAKENAKENTASTTTQTPSKSSAPGAALPPGAVLASLESLANASLSLHALAQSPAATGQLPQLTLEKLAYHTLVAVTNVAPSVGSGSAGLAAGVALTCLASLQLLLHNDHSLPPPPPPGSCATLLATPPSDFTTGSTAFDASLAKIVVGSLLNAAATVAPLLLTNKLDDSLELPKAVVAQLREIKGTGGAALPDALLPPLLAYIQLLPAEQRAVYMSRAHSTLWALASKVDKIPAFPPHASLNLRLHSLRPLLEKTPKEARVKFFDQAASCALRTVNNYASQRANQSNQSSSTPSKTPSKTPAKTPSKALNTPTKVANAPPCPHLKAFHNTIAPLLAKMAGPDTNTEHYAEYCAWQQTSSSDPTAPSAHLSAFDPSGALALTALNIATSLHKSEASKSTEKEVSNLASSLRVFMKTEPAPSPKLLARNYRIIAQSKLTSRLTTLLQSDSTIPNAKLISYLLLHVFAPLSRAASLNTYCDVMLKTLAVAEHSTSESTSALSAITKILKSESTPPATSLVIVKQLSSIARSCPPLQSLPLLLLSLPVFASAAASDDMQARQLHLRYGFIGQTLRNLNLHNHAMACYAIGMHCYASLSVDEMESRIVRSEFLDGDIASFATNFLAAFEKTRDEGDDQVDINAVLTGGAVDALKSTAIADVVGSNGVFGALEKAGDDTTVPLLVGMVLHAAAANKTKHDELYQSAASALENDSNNLRRVYVQAAHATSSFDRAETLYGVAASAVESATSASSASPLLLAVMHTTCGKLGMKHPDNATKAKAADHLNAAFDIVKTGPMSHEVRNLISTLRDAFVFLRQTIQSLQCTALLEGSSAPQDWAGFGYRRCYFDDLAIKYGSDAEINKLVVTARSSGDTATIVKCVNGLNQHVAALEAQIADDTSEDVRTHQFNFIEGVLGMIECQEMIGDFRSAVMLLKKGVIMCKDAVRSSRRSGDMIWVQFLSELLCQLGAMWGKLGDKRRAEGYVCAAGECLGMKMFEIKEAAVVLGSTEEEPDQECDAEEDAPVLLNEAIVDRLSNRLRLLALPAEKTKSQVRSKSADSAPPSKDIERNLELINSLLSDGDNLRRCCDGDDNGFMKIYRSADELLGMMRDDGFGDLLEKAVGMEEKASGDSKTSNAGRLGALRSSILVRLSPERSVWRSPATRILMDSSQEHRPARGPPGWRKVAFVDGLAVDVVAPPACPESSLE